MPADVRGAVEAVWRIESARIVATLTVLTDDVGRAEDLAQDALIEALDGWARQGIPDNPGAWITAVAKRRAIDAWRRDGIRDDRYRTLAADITAPEDVDVDPIHDDVLRLIFIACHPVLSRESQVALTLRVVGGLTTEEIARMLMVQVPTVQARITRAKKTLTAAQVPFETPDPSDWAERLDGVLGVAYLMFTEGYAATTGDQWIRAELAAEALRLARRIAVLVPTEPEAHALVSLLELQSSRFAARTGPDGAPVLLADQDRRRWDRSQIARGREALVRADRLGRGRGAYALQAAIAEQHALAPTVVHTDWDEIVLLYAELARRTANPMVTLNLAVATAMRGAPAEALAIVDGLVAEGQLEASHVLLSARGEILRRLDRTAEARRELRAAADRATNAQIRATLLAKAAEIDDAPR